jgi:RHS repeat-associated protein
MIFDKTGRLAGTERHDYLPFGEELYANVGIRSTTLGYTAAGNTAADKVRQKFTEQERDDETNLDYMHARYFANVQGRFTSVDPLQASARPGSPQSWNRYSYALNNPLRYSDPSGLTEFDDLRGPGVGNPQDSDDEERRREEILAEEADDEAEQQQQQQPQQPSPPLVDYFELGVPPPPPLPKGAGPIPASSKILGVIPGEDKRGSPYSYVSETGIQISVGVQFYDQNGKPYYVENDQGDAPIFAEEVTTMPGGVQAPGMSGQPETGTADLNRGGQVGDRHKYEAGPNNLPDNLNVVRRQIMYVIDPNTAERYDVGHYEIRYSKTHITIVDYSKGKANAKNLGEFTPLL